MEPLLRDRPESCCHTCGTDCLEVHRNDSGTFVVFTLGTALNSTLALATEIFGIDETLFQRGLTFFFREHFDLLFY